MIKKQKHYLNIEAWANAMRKDITQKLWADWFNIGGDWYVIEEYDDAGHFMRLASITANRIIDIATEHSRYTSQWLKNASIINYEADGYRFDWTYYISQEELDALKSEKRQEVLATIEKYFK